MFSKGMPFNDDRVECDDSDDLLTWDDFTTVLYCHFFKYVKMVHNEK